MGWDCRGGRESARVTPWAVALAVVLAGGAATGCVDGASGACRDDDGDGYGADNDPACVFAGTDCDDGNPWVNPGAPEICGNGIDDDCRGGDEPCAEAHCADQDGDGYGDGPLCAGPDCDDHDAAVHPGAGEICGDGVDNDCAGGDRSCPPSCTDADGDGYGAGAGCWGPDCDDHDAAVNPGAFEICGDGVDNDCAGGDEPCLPACGDGWTSLGTLEAGDMIVAGDYADPDPDRGAPWVLLSPGTALDSSATAWAGWFFDADLAGCATDVSVFVWAYDDSSVGTGADIAFDAGDGSPGDRIANVDAEETWYGGSAAAAGHLDCDAYTCALWIVVTAGMFDRTHVLQADAAVYLAAS